VTPRLPPSKAPLHLAAATRAWFEAVLREYALEGHHARLLQAAAEAWDEAQEARATLRKVGPTYTDRFGQPRPRPEIRIAHTATLIFTRALRELRLDVQADDDPRVPPLNGGRARHA
jgi:hypothetical protein